MSAYFDLDDDGQHRGRGRSQAMPSTVGKFASIWDDDRVLCLGSIYAQGALWGSFDGTGKSIGLHPSRESAIARVRRVAP